MLFCEHHQIMLKDSGNFYEQEPDEQEYINMEKKERKIYIIQCATPCFIAQSVKAVKSDGWNYRIHTLLVNFLKDLKCMT